MSKNILKELHMAVYKKGANGDIESCAHSVGLSNGQIFGFKKAYLVDDMIHIWPIHSEPEYLQKVLQDKGLSIKNSEIVWVAEFPKEQV